MLDKLKNNSYVQNLINLRIEYLVALMILFALVVFLVYYITRIRGKLNKDKVRRIVESELIDNNIDLDKVNLEEPEKKKIDGEVIWSIIYQLEGEYQKILISEEGDIIEKSVSESEAKSIAKKEFKKRGIDLLRVKINENLKEVNGEYFWEIKYTTSYGYSDRILVSKNTGEIID